MPGEEQSSLSANPEKSICRHCKLEIVAGAAVCSHCGHYQNRWLNFIEPSILISLCLLILSGLQLYSANIQRQLAQAANSNAQAALLKVQETKKEILDVSEAVLNISEILPRTGGWGGGISNQDQKRLSQYSDLLKQKVEESRQK